MRYLISFWFTIIAVNFEMISNKICEVEDNLAGIDKLE